MRARSNGPPGLEGDESGDEMEGDNSLLEDGVIRFHFLKFPLPTACGDCFYFSLRRAVAAMHAQHGEGSCKTRTILCLGMRKLVGGLARL